MAIRYSGDVEIRISFARGKYRASLRAPGFRATGEISRVKALGGRSLSPTGPEAYDVAALALLREARVQARAEGFVLPTSGTFAIEVRRTFQSPCPTIHTRGARD